MWGPEKLHSPGASKTKWRLKKNNKILNSDLSATSFSLNSWPRVRQLAFAGVCWLWDNVSLVLWIDSLVSSYMTLFSIQVFWLCSFFALVSLDYFDLNLCPLFFSGPQRLSIWLLWCDSGVNAELLRGGVRFVLQMFPKPFLRKWFKMRICLSSCSSLCEYLSEYWILAWLRAYLNASIQFIRFLVVDLF